MTKDPYAVLGVARNASPDDIKAAYRRLAKRLHPDMSPGNGAHEQRFKEVCSAYALLRDPESRARYDKARRRALRQQRSAMATMAASFVLTLGSGSLVGVWLGLHGPLW